MFGIGGPELVLIFILALLIFGPKRLPQIGRTIGKGMSEFRRASTELQRAVNTEFEEQPAWKKPLASAPAVAAVPPASASVVAPDPLPPAASTAEAPPEPTEPSAADIDAMLAEVGSPAEALVPSPEPPAADEPDPTTPPRLA